MKEKKVEASFFLTGRFYDNPAFKSIITQLKAGQHYLGLHSYNHLLYCDWTKRDSLLVTEKEFKDDMVKSIKAIGRFGIPANKIGYFIPPFEWYNDSISKWSLEINLQLLNYTSGTFSTADYTTPVMKNYRSSGVIYQSILDYESKSPSGLNGFILLIHIGTDPARTDKFYKRLPRLIDDLKIRGYRFEKVDEMLMN